YHRLQQRAVLARTTVLCAAMEMEEILLEADRHVRSQQACGKARWTRTSPLGH
ncbi:hypothetical protein CRENBAI_026182, partial [Crenichthys baileyi]